MWWRMMVMEMAMVIGDGDGYNSDCDDHPDIFCRM